MEPSQTFDIFLSCAPGLEPMLAEEALAAGFADPKPVPGGVETRGGWPEVWRANLEMRGATRVLARVGSFRAMHLAQLDKRARKFPWAEVLSANVPVKVEATCRASRIYHAGAAAERIARAIAEELGAPQGDGGIKVMARIEDDLCTISLDTSGELLHIRGHKQSVGKAPLRETLAALFLRAAGFDGREPVVDPMCGSGTFPIEAAEIAAGLKPGRSRSFAFESLPSFDPAAWAAMREAPPPATSRLMAFGSDRDAGAVAGARANAERAGVAAWCDFRQHAVSDLTPPDGPPGLVMVNPPYGARIGNRQVLFGLYGALGKTLMARFHGWRVGLVTSDDGLARATGLPFLPPGPLVDHGGLKIRLHRTAPLR